MRQRLWPAVAGAGLLGAAILYSSRSSSAAGRAHPAAKRDEGLSGAGIGGNMSTGGHELSSANSASSSQEKVHTTAASRDQLPSDGGVGGGYGAGNHNARAIELPGTRDRRQPAASDQAGQDNGDGTA